MKLSEQLKKVRTDRPDEWSMDRYIKEAEKLESDLRARTERMHELSDLVDELQSGYRS